MSIDFPLISSGISGLDEILCGGFATARVYLIYGQPGSGKTMLGQHFLEAGLENDEIVLSIHGEESRSELLTSAAAVGIDLEGASFLDLGPESEYFTDEQTYDLVDPGEIERDKYTQEIYGAIRDVDPDRVVVDPITQLRYVQSSDGQFRRQILSFIRFLKEEGITVLAMATPSPEREYDKEIRSLSDGIVELEYGDGGRRIGVPKHRNIGQVDGKHGIEIRDDGIQVFPALVPEKHSQSIDQGQISGGIDELDELLGGGIERNTVTFISGPTGVGKSTLGAQVLSEAAASGTAAIYLFEESVETISLRSEAMGLPISELREEGSLLLRSVEPMARSAEEFASIVRRDVEEEGVNTVMIDGIDGYTMAIQGDERELLGKLHSLSRYLTNNGVTMVVTDEVTEVTGVSSATSVNASYIADNIVVLSYVEMDSELRKVIGVLKKRASPFEQTLRELSLTEDGIEIGEPLTGFTGILQGMPRASDDAQR